MKLRSPEDLFLDGLQSIYDVEQQLVQTLPQIAESCSSPQLRSAFEEHLTETKEHVGRAEEIFKRIGKQPEAKPSKVMKQMLDQTQEILHATEPSPIRDAALIIAGNQVEHFEIACYGSLCSLAQLLGREDEASIFEKTLDEEKKADAKLTEIGEQHVNIQAVHRSVAAGRA